MIALVLLLGRSRVLPTTLCMLAMMTALAINGLGYRAAWRDFRASRSVHAMYPSEWCGLALFLSGAVLGLVLDGLPWYWRLVMVLMPVGQVATAWRRQREARRRAGASLVSVFE